MLGMCVFFRSFFLGLLGGGKGNNIASRTRASFSMISL